MPRASIPSFSPRGLYTYLDSPGSSSGAAQYTYYLNGYFEKGEDPNNQDRAIAFVKRPGMNRVITSNFNNNHKIQGFASAFDKSSMIAYSNNGATATTWFITTNGVVTNKGTAPAAAGTWTNTGPVYITPLDGISYGAGNFYAVTDFTKGALISSSGAWTEIVNANFTGLTKVTNFQCLDGYLFIGTSNNRIYNSDLNIPGTWSATSFLVAADTPGTLLWLSKIRNYLVAFKSRSIEFFEDLGNPTPGSPLEPRRQLNRTIGCINPNSIQEVADGIIFAGAGISSAPKLYKIMKDTLQIVEISDRLMEQTLALNGFNNTYSVDARATALALGQSQVFGFAGKEFYSITLKDPNTNVTGASTHIFDNDLGVWVNWASSMNATGTPDLYGFECTQAQMLNFNGAYGAWFVCNSFSNAGAPPKLMFFDLSGLSLNYADNSTNNVQFSWTTGVIDLGSRRRKFLDAVEVLYSGLQYTAPNTTGTTVAVSLNYMDFEYSAIVGWVVTKNLTADLTNGTRCRATQLGNFRKRVFNVYTTNTNPFKVWGLELDYNDGENDDG